MGRSALSRCNPVLAAMVGLPGDYRWSSHARNAHASLGPRITSIRPTCNQARMTLPAGSDRFQKQIEALNQRAATVGSPPCVDPCSYLRAMAGRD